MKVGILGYGEVGKAIAKFYSKPLIRDKDKNEFENKLDILNVCIPYSKKFIQIIEQNIKEYNPGLVIIHSTVPIGTTKKIFEKYPIVVHSPIRGVHPNLYKGIKTFDKIIGSDDCNLTTRTYIHFRDIGINHVCMGYSSKDSEAAKLLDTTYYGWNIIFERFIKEFCDKNKLNFDQVYTNFNNSYNSGYSKLGLTNVVRPIIKHQNWKIGGHCVISNCLLLNDFLPARIINKQNNKFTKKYGNN